MPLCAAGKTFAADLRQFFFDKVGSICSSRRMGATAIPILQRSLTVALVLSAALMFGASHKRGVLPAEKLLRPELSAEPEQVAVTDRAFIHEWRGEKFVVHPVAEYSITGLLVSRNDIGGFSDIYHTASSVDVVDVCLVWGENAREEVYRSVEFGSEPFSCWYRAPNAEAFEAFRPEQLSNTHLLARDEPIARRLSGLHIGDQIRLRGRLVNYNPAGASEMLRKSSLVRDDTGNGACEILFVDELDVLERGNPGWNKLFDYSRAAFMFLLAAKIFSMLVFPYLEYRYT